MEEIIRKNCIRVDPKRKALSEKTIYNYIQCIRNISKAIYQPLESQEDLVTHFDQIMEYLMVLKTTSRKTKLAAIAVAMRGSPDIETIAKYNLQRIEDSAKIKDNEKKQIQTKSVIKNYVSWEHVMERYEMLKLECKELWKFPVITSKQFFTLQDFVLLSCFVLIEPRRPQDFSEFKIRNYDINNDNYMIYNKGFKNSWLVFNKYKMSYKYGQARVELPQKLKKILIDWCAKNPYDYLFVNGKYRNCDQPRISRYINEIFELDKEQEDKNVGINTLRHAWNTFQYGNVNLENLQNTAHNMGSGTTDRVLAYVVKEGDEGDDGYPPSEGDTVTIVSDSEVNSELYDEDSDIEIEFTPDDLQP